MSFAALIRAMTAAGAPPEAIALAVEAVEASEQKLTDKRAVERDRKRRQRALSKDSHGTVTGQSGDRAGQPPTPAPSFPPDPQTNPTPTPEGDTPRARKAVPFLLPDDWQPKPFGLGTKSRGIVDGWPPGELETQLEHFRAHHRSKGSKFKDWQDAWSTWALTSRRFGASNGRQRQPVPQARSPIVAEYLRTAAELAAQPESQEPDYGTWPALPAQH